MPGMSVRISMDGLDALREELEALPPELQQEARTAVVRETQAGASELRAIYPEKTGNLRRGVRTKIIEKASETAGVILSLAPHAHLWEYGTVNRTTEKGWNRGRMPNQLTRGLTAIGARHQRDLERVLWTIVDRLALKGAA